MSPKSKSKKAPTEDTKERFLSVAERIFAQKGYRGTTTREISDGVGVNISSLHFHWNSKETLFLEVLKRNSIELKQIISKWDIDPGSERLRSKQMKIEMVSSFVEDLVEFAIRKKYFVRIMVHRWLEEGTGDREVEEKMMAPLVNLVSSRMRLVLEKGLEKKMDPDHITISFLWVIIGYVIGGPLHGLVIEGDIESPETMKMVKEHVTNMALRAFGLA